MIQNKLLRLLELLEILNNNNALRPEFEVFAKSEEPIETIDELINVIEDEISYWEP